MTHKIDCRKLNKTISTEQDKSVFQSLKDNDIPIASSCKGEGVCRWCKILIEVGENRLNPMTDLEKKAPLEKGERLSCQVFINGDICISTSYW